jgi:hypothetical protein
VRVGADGRVRALTVTKNITYASYWAFNLHTFDTARAIPYVSFGQVVLSREFLDAEQVAHLPWGLCARVRGGQLEFKAWPLTETEPAWGDPLHGGRAPIPAGWDTAGRPGWYIGHLHPGETARYDAMTTWQLGGAAAPTAPLPAPGAEPEVVAAERPEPALAGPNAD